MRSFTSFLAEHGQNLQRLTISSHDGTAEGEAAAAAATADCLSAAGARGQLSKLRASGSIRSTEWLVAMPSLRRLQLYSQPHSSPLHVSSAISSLTALSELELEGAITFSAGTHLPASIECLALSRDPSAAIPGQVAQLPLLASLCVSACNYSSASVNQLSHLRGSLTRLDIGSGWMPGSLSVVTQLQDLKLRDSYMPQEGLVSAALPHLSQLTRLNIQTADFEVVAALAGLSKLQLCSLDLHVLRDDTAPPLPAGPWLASLSRLHYNVGGLISSTAVLQNAAALEFLSAGNSRFAKLIDWYSRATIAFFDWLAEHPPLRCVFFDVTHGRLFNSGFFAAHIMQPAA